MPIFTGHGQPVILNIAFQDEYVNNMTADALVPCGPRSSAAIVWTVWAKWLFLFYGELF